MRLQYELEESDLEPEWSSVRLLPATGIIGLGLDSTESYLLAVGRHGREVFRLTNGKRQARDDLATAGELPWEINGLGPIEGQNISLWGQLGRQTPKERLYEAQKISNGVTAINAALCANDGRLMVISQADGIYIYERVAPEYFR